MPNNQIKDRFEPGENPCDRCRHDEREATDFPCSCCIHNTTLMNDWMGAKK